MLVFIDDSGDAGFKIGQGSSQFFVIACVIFEDNLDAEETGLKIKRLRRALGWRDEEEFKFNKSNKQVRLRFLNDVSQCNFKIRAILVDKTLIRSSELRSRKDKFYNYMIKEVLSNSAGQIQNASIRLDGHEDRAYKRAASSYFRTQANPRGAIIKDLRFVDSKTNSLIQLADMVAGSILRSAQTDKTDHSDYLKVLKSRIDDIWNFR